MASRTKTKLDVFSRSWPSLRWVGILRRWEGIRRFAILRGCCGQPVGDTGEGSQCCSWTKKLLRRFQSSRAAASPSSIEL